MTGVNQQEQEPASTRDAREIKEVLSIGALSRATGIPAETLRTWERRYGFPLPQTRTPGGHRLYSPTIIARLELLREAIAQGYRPGQVVPMEIVQLAKLLEAAIPGALSEPFQIAHGTAASRARDAASAASEARGNVAQMIDRWITLGRGQQGVELEEELGRQWFKHGGTIFLQEYMAPLIREVGERWAAKELSVAEEHFISERLRDFLVAQWRPMSRRTRFSTTYICACLPHERHTLALHMVASVLALHGHKIVFLGADLPLEELVAMNARAGAHAICLSLSTAGDSKDKEAMIRELDARLLPSTHILLGGQGAQPLREGSVIRGSRRLHVLNTLPELEKWLVRTQGRPVSAS